MYLKFFTVLENLCLFLPRYLAQPWSGNTALKYSSDFSSIQNIYWYNGQIDVSIYQQAPDGMWLLVVHLEMPTNPSISRYTSLSLSITILTLKRYIQTAVNTVSRSCSAVYKRPRASPASRSHVLSRVICQRGWTNLRAAIYRSCWQHPRAFEWP